MALTEKQDIPAKPTPPSEPWTFRKLFPFKATVSSITKSFTNPFDILLCFLILIIGISELIGHQASWMMYVLATSILTADVVERQKVLPEKKKEKK